MEALLTKNIHTYLKNLKVQGNYKASQILKKNIQNENSYEF